MGPGGRLSFPGDGLLTGRWDFHSQLAPSAPILVEMTALRRVGCTSWSVCMF